MEDLVNFKWKKINSSKVSAYQLGDEPEVLYLINIRENEYMVVFEDAYDLNTGEVKFHNKEEIFNIYGITV